MTKSEIAKLKELAKQATPGPWKTADDRADDIETVTPIVPGPKAFSKVARSTYTIDASFIAHANPAAILGLIAKLERYEAALEMIKEKDGFCIYGSSETSDDPDHAFRQGSAYTYSECASIARKALDEGSKT